MKEDWRTLRNYEININLYHIYTNINQESSSVSTLTGAKLKISQAEERIAEVIFRVDLFFYVSYMPFFFRIKYKLTIAFLE